MKTIYLLYFYLTALCIGTLSCNRPDNEFPMGNVHLQFSHTIDGQALVTGDKEFTNAAGNKYRVEKIKYYVSNIELTKAGGTVHKIPDGYFLIEETGLDTRISLELPYIPAAAYTSLSFAIGVDSARNFSTEMVGDLNPNNDMAWNWVSGYKFFLLEGKFTTASQATGAIVYHIGGNTSLRRVVLTPPAGSFQVSSGKITDLGIEADVNRVFDARNLVDLNQLNAIMQPGSEAGQIADNYAAGLFRLHHVQTK